MNQVVDRKSIANALFVFGTFTLAASISVSKFTTSLSIFLIAFAWFLQWNWKEKMELYQLKKKKFWILSLTYLLFTIGIIYSSDIDYALKDLRIKAPLFALPILFITGHQLNRKQLIWTFIFLCSSAITASLIGFINNKIKIDTPEEITDLRRLSPFISHIRLVLILCFSTAFSLWAFTKSSSPLKWMLLFPIIWIAYFIIYTGSLTGLALFPIILAWWVFYFLWRRYKKTAITFLIVGVLLSIFSGIQVFKIYQLTFSKKTITAIGDVTIQGNKYDDFSHRKGSENGYSTWSYVCEKELEESWNKISNHSFNSDLNSFPFKDVIIRYITSMGLTKDSEGIKQLQNKDIRAIEKGIANIYYTEHNPIANRIHTSLWEIKAKQDLNYLNGGSLSMRLEFWKTGWEIFNTSPIYGIGTGDIERAFKDTYLKNNTVLSNRYKRRSHNQYLSVLITSGIIGLIVFIFAVFYPLRIYQGEFKFLFIAFVLIISISMLWEDTIETQAGATIFGLLYSIFISEEKVRNK